MTIETKLEITPKVQNKNKKYKTKQQWYNEK